MYLHSISAYVDKIVDELDPESAKALKEFKTEREVMILHGTWGRAIRNDFGLWNRDHPLTAEWHKGINNDIRDGVDHSLDHPDAVSTAIMVGVWKKVTA